MLARVTDEDIRDHFLRQCYMLLVSLCCHIAR